MRRKRLIRIEPSSRVGHLSGEGALDNRTRKRLYDHIMDHPGVSFKVLSEAFRMKDGTLRYHLQYLIGEGLIVRSSETNRRCYFCTGVKKNLLLGRSVPGRLNDQQKRLLEIVAMRPGIDHNDLWMTSRQTRNELNDNLRALIDLGFIWKVRTAHGIGYEFITETGLYKEILGLVVEKVLKDELSLDEFQKIRDRLKKIMED
jgi:predicted transcriptional regulator